MAKQDLPLNEETAKEKDKANEPPTPEKDSPSQDQEAQGLTKVKNASATGMGSMGRSEQQEGSED